MNNNNQALSQLSNSPRIAASASFVGSSNKLQEKIQCRRAACVYRKLEFPSKCARIEGQQITRRKAMRRNAITGYSSQTPYYIKSLRKESPANKFENEHHSVSYIKNSKSRERQRVVFDEHDHLDIEHEGSMQFLSLIRVYHRSMYQVAESATHRLMKRTMILGEIKAEGYTFNKKSVLCHRNMLIVTDVYVLARIEDRLKVEESQTKLHGSAA